MTKFWISDISCCTLVLIFSAPLEVEKFISITKRTLAVYESIPYWFFSNCYHELQSAVTQVVKLSMSAKENVHNSRNERLLLLLNNSHMTLMLRFIDKSANRQAWLQFLSGQTKACELSLCVYAGCPSLAPLPTAYLIELLPWSGSILRDWPLHTCESSATLPHAVSATLLPFSCSGWPYCPPRADSHTAAPCLFCVKPCNLEWAPCHTLPNTYWLFRLVSYCF